MKAIDSRILTLGLALVFLLAAAGPPRLLAGTDGAETKIDINTATAAQLETLPRIGAKVAQRIIEFREKNGPFRKIEELMKVRGVGEKVFAGLKDRVTVEKPKKK